MGETAFSRILGRGRSGALAGWNPDNPVGLNPAWEQELRDLGVTRPNGSRGTVLQAINDFGRLVARPENWCAVHTHHARKNTEKR